MLGTTFYNESIKKAIVGFGTLFNNINIERADASGTKETIKVPLAFASRARMVQHLESGGGVGESQPEVRATLPRMSFEWMDMSYDSTRKLNTMQRTATVTSSDNTKLDYRWQRVPYNIDFQLSIYVNTTEDGLKIVEQILPFFTPEFTLTINDVVKTDVPVVLSGLTKDDQWEGTFTQERIIIWNLDFQAKTYLYGPQKSAKVITKTIMHQYANIFSTFDSPTASIPTQAASKIVTVPNPTTADADDSYTYTETKTE
tara:strand:- start:590 stop:1363 length:774 start_codon:yes stop_codon:yes gene_type:complete